MSSDDVFKRPACVAFARIDHEGNKTFHIKSDEDVERSTNFFKPHNGIFVLGWFYSDSPFYDDPWKEAEKSVRRHGGKVEDDAI